MVERMYRFAAGDKKQKSGRTIDLVLVRHGTTSWNIAKRYVGHADPGLAAFASEELMPLRKQLSGGRFAAVWSSDLRRCRETLLLAAPKLAVSARQDERLREMDFGEWDGCTYEMLKEQPVYRAWIDRPQQVTPPGGESWNAFAARVHEVIETIVQQVTAEGVTAEAGVTGEQGTVPVVLVITHGGVIRQMASMLGATEAFWDLSVPPGGMITLRVQAGLEGLAGRQVSYPFSIFTR
ncbi:histidine phosphatase family protein [Paenibacillus sp. JX-17]|uniref:Histidine phosphatase family protein n=1 Tax=Paenibacillus lacisoli TaxID=3064525 RepID=A0ABT9CFB3_9BACL|nr:histidine phosphatase family protein [Paenibacillus sp. JX-17]MDO7907329.1 histidine phosphatase family protein [Paenibacillus sp. JX-17]